MWTMSQFPTSQSTSAPLSANGDELQQYIAGLPQRINFFPLYLSVA